jgi:hypothetical protein
MLKQSGLFEGRETNLDRYEWASSVNLLVTFARHVAGTLIRRNA